MIPVTLYVKSGCWLCDAAEEMLGGLSQKRGLLITKVDIESTEELYELYRFDIPVVEFADGTALHHSIKKKALLKAIDANAQNEGMALGAMEADALRHPNPKGGRAMKIFEVSRAAEAEGGEHVLGVKETGTHACYMIYGTLAPREEGRRISPGAGHEEIVIAVKGTLKVSGPAFAPVREIVLPEGSAFHVAGDTECFLANTTGEQAVYVAAGGHTPGAGH